MDWEFFFNTEHGRDKLLRDRLEQYQGDAAAARSVQRRRFQQQISTLRGDLDTRLTALSRAFESYVALDDVREQLAGFPDRAQARRRATEALQALDAGRQPEPLDDIADYWLPPAVNALQLGGGVDEALLGTALARDEASTHRFLAGVLGAAGHGRAGAQHAIAALSTPRWDDAQQLIWLAIADGVFGDQAIAQLHRAVQPALGAPGQDGWEEWLLAREDGSEVPLGWLINVYSAETTESETDTGRHHDDLRGVAMIEVTAGSPPEQPLIARARHLRALVRNPMAPAVPETAEGTDTGTEVVEVLRRAAIDRDGPATARRLARSWIAPQLLAVLDRIPPAAEPTPTILRAKMPLLDLTVSAAGPDPAELDRARRQIAERHIPSNRPLIRGGSIGGGLLVLAAVCFILQWTVPGFLLAAAGLAVGIHGFWRWQQEQQMVLAGQEAVERLDQAVERTQRQAHQQDLHNAEVHQERLEEFTRARTVVAQAAQD
ncbi:hypothetical protein [Enemella sp. A6]|uniref:hypothetical protein n=1 Tax=Enemella sp. A6 TaxID=3440152 RepID=UPI003EBF35F1